MGYPKVPNVRAFSSPDAPSKVSTAGPNSTPVNPASSMTSRHPAHGRAPAIQAAHRSMSFFAPSGTARSTQMSLTWSRPPGRRTRKISR